MVTSFNLRAGTASVGPVLRDLQASLGMPDSVAGLLVALPPLSFGVVGLLSGPLSRRFDAERLMAVFSLFIAAGLIVRVLTGSLGIFMLASLGAIVGISVVNIMVPVLIRRWFPDQVARLSGTYSMILTYGAFFGAAFTVPFGALIGGWRGGLALWAAPAVLGPALLAVARRRGRREHAALVRAIGDEAAGAATPTMRRERPDCNGPRPPSLRIYRSPKAWALACFLGFQALEAFTILGWLPAILRDDGVSAAQAGWLLSITMLVAAPMSILFPRLTARYPDQRPVIAPLIVCSAVAYVLLLISPARFALISVILLGIGMSTFSLALVLIGLRASTDRGTAELASMVQGVGFLLAGTGPILFGWLFERTGAWQLPLWSLLILLVPKTFVGMVVGRPGVIVDEDPIGPGRTGDSGVGPSTGEARPPV